MRGTSPQVNGSRGVVTRFMSRADYEAELRSQLAAAKRSLKRGGDLPLSPGGGGGGLSSAGAQLERVSRQLQLLGR